MSWYVEVLKKYAVFRGRARRKEYWYFTLFNVIASILLSVVDFALGTFNSQAGVGLLSSIYALAVLIPSIAVAVRRLHDTGRAGWWVLIALVPLVGAIVFLIFAALDGDTGNNGYGPDPKTRVA